MSIKLFVTGTDTNVGKTYVSASILNAFSRAKYSTLGIKPIASGCTLSDGILKNSDALALQAASTIKLAYHHINPIALEPAIAPHIAAHQVNRDITVDELRQKTQYAFQHPVDICLVEGAGGWHTPLNNHETLADYAKSLRIPVLLVVGIRLGCINHAILTHQAIEKAGIPIAGWIANVIDPNMKEYRENIETLKHWLSSPCLGVLNYGETQFSLADFLITDNMSG